MSMKSWIIGALLLAGSLVYFFLLPDSAESTAELDALVAKQRRVAAIQTTVIEPDAARSTPPLQTVSVPVEATLDENRQKHIWDLEHHTFELEWKFGSLVKQAIKEKDRQGLVDRFLLESEGRIPSLQQQHVVRESWWRQHTLGGEDGHTTWQEADAGEVADFLIDAFFDFTEIKNLGLRVLAIDRDAEIENQYDLKILLTASGSDRSGPASLSSLHRLIVQFDNDQDISDGKIVKYWAVDSLSTRGSNAPFLAEVTNTYGLDKLDLTDNWKSAPGVQIDTYTCQVAVDDFDQDGFLDIAISSLQGKQYLLRSVDGESFEDVTEQVGLPAKRFSSDTTYATWIDYDNDGFPDLLIGKNMYHNEQGRRFQLRTSTVGLKFESATKGAVVVDYDCDGWLDLYVLNDFDEGADHTIGFVEDDTKTGVKNQLWRNLGSGEFQDVTRQAGVDGADRHSFAAAWFHANDDHFPDLYLVNDFGRNCFYLNRGNGQFDDITEQAGVGDFANSMGVATGDLDNDGTSEIYVANMFSKMGRRIIAHVSEGDFPEGVYHGIQGACAGSHLYKRSGQDQRYDEISVKASVNEIGWAYAPVFADFDADGLLDIYATSGFISVDRHKPDG